MNENFKAGDKVVCKDNFGMQKFLSVGKQYDVKGFSSGYLLVVQDNGIEGKCFTYRFELIEHTYNGVNAEGKAIFFDLANLKSWQRVVTVNDFRYIVAEQAGVTVLVRDGAWNGEPSMTGSFALEAVYAAPDPEDYLNLQAQGELVWKRQAQKTPEQAKAELAQEAAVAARNKAIEEAEKALKIAQEKLAELKGM